MMEYKGYYADVKYSDEDKLFIGEVMGLNDTLAFHGSSVSELEAMFRQSVDNYLETCQEYGKKPGRSREETGAGYNSAATQLASAKSLAKVKQMQYNVTQKEGDIDGS